jgi:acyl carrier protein
MLTEQEIFEQVREILIDTLGVEPEEVTPEANFFYDLGGESIDVLDLSFRCEKQFGVRLRFQDLQAQVQAALNSAEFQSASLQSAFPFLDAELLAALDRERPAALFTVETIVRCVEHALAQPAEKESLK